MVRPRGEPRAWRLTKEELPAATWYVQLEVTLGRGYQGIGLQLLGTEGLTDMERALSVEFTRTYSAII